jgi:hypothetical protein
MQTEAVDFFGKIWALFTSDQALRLVFPFLLVTGCACSMLILHLPQLGAIFGFGTLSPSERHIAGFIAFISFVALIVYLVFAIFIWLQSNYAEVKKANEDKARKKRREDLIIEQLEGLSSSEQSLLAEFLSSNSRTSERHIAAGTIQSLLTKGLLEQSASMSMTYSMPVSIPLFVWHHLKSDAERAKRLLGGATLEQQ